MSQTALKALIVDDELAARQSLSHYLAKYCPQVEVLGTADSVQTALSAITRLKPNLLFLDVEMPYGNAFDLLDQVGDSTFSTIFVTAYDHYAIQALNFSAAYYLLKPIDIDELVAAVEKVAQLGDELPRQALLDQLKQIHPGQQKVVLPVMEGFEVVKVQEIIRCQAKGNFTDFILSEKKKKMICRPLKFYEELLSPLGFMRVHKSHLVNLDYVVGYRKGKGGLLRLKNGDEVEVAPSRKQALLDRF